MPSTADDLAPLRTARTASGYRFVYPHGRRFQVRWKLPNPDGTVVWGGLPGSFATATAAAKAAAAALRERLGPGWRAAVGAARRPRPWSVWRCDAENGWAADVFVGGKKVMLYPDGPDEEFFPTPEAARQAVRDWFRLRPHVRASLHR